MEINFDICKKCRHFSERQKDNIASGCSLIQHDIEMWLLDVTNVMPTGIAIECPYKLEHLVMNDDKQQEDDI